MNTIEKIQNSKLFSYTLIAGLFIVPLSFSPFSLLPTDALKTTLIWIVFAVLFFVFIRISIKENKLPYIGGAIGITSTILIVSILISVIGSDSPIKSFLGQGFESYTGSLLLVYLILSGMVAIHFSSPQKRENLVKIAIPLVIVFCIFFLLHLVRSLFGADTLSFGFLSQKTSTFIGRWNDIAIFAGIIFTSILALIYSKIGNSFIRILSYVLLITSSLFLFITNFPIVWMAVFTSSLIILISHFIKERKIIILPLVVCIVSISMFFYGPRIVGGVVERMGLVESDVFLNWQSTIDVSSETFKNSPLFGAGPNRFLFEYLLYKPVAINLTPFYNFEFNAGYGAILTSIVTLGFIGFSSIIAIFIFMFRNGFESYRENRSILLLSTGSISLFSAVVLFNYNPSQSILFIFSIIFGIFLSELIMQGRIKVVEIDFGESKKRYLLKTGLFSIAVLFLVWNVGYARKIIALTHFQSGLANLEKGGDINVTKEKFLKARAWGDTDIYEQAISEANLAIALNLANSLNQESSAGEDKAQAQDPNAVAGEVSKLLEASYEATKRAINIDPSNHYNHIAEARVSELALSLGVTDAYEKAINSYNNALNRNPINPVIFLNVASMEANRGEFALAKQNIGNALTLKPNFIDALYLLVGVQVREGNIDDAIISAQRGVELLPNNPASHFELALLYYNDNNFKLASESLKKAVELNSEFDNGRYFLGLSYARLGQPNLAIEEFTKLAEKYPDNETVIDTLTKLKSGRSIFTNTNRESSNNLPIQEEQ